MKINLKNEEHLEIDRNGVKIVDIDDISTAVRDKCIELGLYTPSN